MRPGRKRSLPGLFLLLRERKVRNLMELKVKAPYEPLNVEIGDQEVACRINVTPDGLLSIGEACSKAEQKIKQLEKLYNDAKEAKNVAKMRKVNAHIADVIEPAIRAGIGEEGYDAIFEACGASGPVSKADCNIVMVEVFGAVYETVKERREDSLNEKAAHYLAEVDDAQSEPDTED